MSKKFIPKCLEDLLKKNTDLRFSHEKINCFSCNKEFLYEPRKNIQPLKKHISLLNHKNSSELFLEKILQNDEKIKIFDQDFGEFMVQNNIPLDKIDAPELRKFFDVHLHAKLKS